jgi:hypothetical protein
VASDAINTGNLWNRLRVVAAAVPGGTEFGFYINNVLVWLGKDSDYAGGQIAFAMASNDSNDDLNIDWIRRYSVPTLPSLSAFGTLAPAQQALNNAANAQPDSSGK